MFLCGLGGAMGFCGFGIRLDDSGERSSLAPPPYSGERSYLAPPPYNDTLSLSVCVPKLDRGGRCGQ